MATENLTPNELWLNLNHPKHRHLHREAGDLGSSTFLESVARVELEVVACGKTAFVAETTELWTELEFLSKSYYWIKFNNGRDILQPSSSGVVFKTSDNSEAPRRYLLLFEAGIVKRLAIENFRIHNKQHAGKYEIGIFSDKMTMEAVL